MIARGVLVLFAVALLAVQVVRNAVVVAVSDTRPAVAARFWSSHPDAELTGSMTQIAHAARAGQRVPASVFATIDDAAVKAPISPVPYLVRGVQAQLSGDTHTAERAFVAAQWRDPRSLAAAYFLADRYFRAGDTKNGLRQVAALARLAGSGPQIVAPYIAAYARNPANWADLRGLFRHNPSLADAAYLALASDPRNAPAVLALSGGGRAIAGSQWFPVLLKSLSDAGEYQRAYAIWAQAAGVGPRSGELLHDAGFQDRTSPPPFNWALTASTVGLAERASGGKLHLLFYGQDDGSLARQLLLLAPGTYRLSSPLLPGGSNPQAVTWSLKCDKAAEPLSTGAIGSPWTFTVPPGCRAQWLELVGKSADMPQQTDVTVGAVQLQRVGGNA
jgi:hypothetical protein